MAAFRLVYKGSRSIRGMEVEALDVFCEGTVIAVLLLLSIKVLAGCDIES